MFWEIFNALCYVQESGKDLKTMLWEIFNARDVLKKAKRVKNNVAFFNYTRFGKKNETTTNGMPNPNRTGKLMKLWNEQGFPNTQKSQTL